MHTRTRTLTILILLGGALTAGCGGGGGGGSSDLDLNGWWEITMTQPGPSDPYEFVWLGPATHAGSSVTYYFLDYTFDGTTLKAAEPDFAADPRQEIRLTAQSADLLVGQTQLINAGDVTASRGLRMRRVPVPTGTLTAEMDFGGTSVRWGSPTAYASVRRIPISDGSTDYEVSLIDADPETARGLLMHFNLPPISVYPVELPLPIECQLSYTPAEITYDATSGTVVLEELDLSGRIRGTYDAAFGVDRTGRGTFDVPVRGLR